MTFFTLLDSLIQILVTMLLIVLSSSVYIFFERKALADLEARIGPRKVGWAGFLQPWADLLKVFTKVSRKSSLQFSATGFLVGLLLVTLPLGGRFPLVDSHLNVWLPFVVFWAIHFFSSVLDLKKNHTAAMMTASRKLIYLMGFWLPLLISILGVTQWAGRSNWSQISEAQSGFLGWNIFSSIFGFVYGGIFIISGMALCHIHPLALKGGLIDKGEFEPETALFSYVTYFSFAVLSVGLFFGGGGPLGLETFGLPVSLWVIFKALFLMVGLRLLGSAFIQLRLDQALKLSWSFLVPISVLFLMLEVVGLAQRGFN